MFKAKVAYVTYFSIRSYLTHVCSSYPYSNKQKSNWMARITQRSFCKSSKHRNWQIRIRIHSTSTGH